MALGAAEDSPQAAARALLKLEVSYPLTFPGS